ncbi:MAG: SDR family NAD(P)-dependent oxidoreductase [Pseudomonadota bacterium]
MSAAALGRQLPGQRAFITGGGSGLGLALASQLAAAGWTLGLLDREPSRLADARTQLLQHGAPGVHTWVADVTDEAAFGAAVTAFADAVGGLELMVNNAGVATAGSIASAPIADWRWALEINVIGVAIGCRVALPLMLRGAGGLVINIASAAAFAAGAEMAAYNASKAAVVALTETLAAEHADDGIRALVAMPGFFPTRLLDTMRGPAAALGFAQRMMQRSGYTAERVALEILAAAAAGRLHIVTPKAYARLWLFKRLAPAHFVRWMARQRARAAQRRGGGSTERT